MRVGQCRHVTTVQETTENKDNNRKWPNAQQLRRESVLQQVRQHSISVGMVYGWIHHKLMPGTRPRINRRCPGLSDAHPL